MTPYLLAALLLAGSTSAAEPDHRRCAVWTLPTGQQVRSPMYDAVEQQEEYHAWALKAGIDTLAVAKLLPSEKCRNIPIIEPQGED